MAPFGQIIIDTTAYPDSSLPSKYYIWHDLQAGFEVLALYPYPYGIGIMNHQENVTSDVEIVSSDPSVVEIDQSSGTLQGLHPGTATISANFRGSTAQIDIEVLPRLSELSEYIIPVPKVETAPKPKKNPRPIKLFRSEGINLDKLVYNLGKNETDRLQVNSKSVPRSYLDGFENSVKTFYLEAEKVDIYTDALKRMAEKY